MKNIKWILLAVLTVSLFTLLPLPKSYAQCDAGKCPVPDAKNAEDDETQKKEKEDGEEEEPTPVSPQKELSEEEKEEMREEIKRSGLRGQQLTTALDAVDEGAPNAAAAVQHAQEVVSDAGYDKVPGESSTYWARHDPAFQDQTPAPSPDGDSTPRPSPSPSPSPNPSPSPSPSPNSNPDSATVTLYDQNTGQNYQSQAIRPDVNGMRYDANTGEYYNPTTTNPVPSNFPDSSFVTLDRDGNPVTLPDYSNSTTSFPHSQGSGPSAGVNQGLGTSWPEPVTPTRDSYRPPTTEYLEDGSTTYFDPQRGNVTTPPPSTPTTSAATTTPEATPTIPTISQGVNPAINNNSYIIPEGGDITDRSYWDTNERAWISPKTGKKIYMNPKTGDAQGYIKHYTKAPKK